MERKNNIPYRDTIKSLTNLSRASTVTVSNKDKNKILLAIIFFFTFLIVIFVLFQQQNLKQNCSLLRKEISKKESEYKKLFDLFTDRHRKQEEKIIS